MPDIFAPPIQALLSPPADTRPDMSGRPGGARMTTTATLNG